MKIFRNICFAWASLLSSMFAAENLIAPDGHLGEYVATDDLQWNRYTTQNNFVILSIDDSQGKWLAENLDSFRANCLAKWGFENFKSDIEIRIFSVPNKETLKKLFSIEKPRIEKRDNLIAMWIVLESDLTGDLSPFLQEAVLYDYELHSKEDLPFWFERGSVVLSNNLDKINQELKNLKKTLDENQLLVMDRIFKMDPEAYNKETQDQKELYDRQAAALCLMLRKEFGGIKMRAFLNACVSEGVEKSLKAVYDFNGSNHFAKQYRHYLKDLCSQAAEDKILASYLTIKPL